ncbi:MAG: Na-translocating system protein MpsC family protein [Nostoc sp.]|uniref:Na-translocating system protein MpsC family protein n=1 Tax=Nostoc sp. TaxID=1180 RepID=UPI002FEF5CAC
MVQANIEQLEKEISQRIVKLYDDRLGKSPSQIICHFFDTEIVISLENSVTQAEQTGASTFGRNTGRLEIAATQTKSACADSLKPA